MVRLSDFGFPPLSDRSALARENDMQQGDLLRGLPGPVHDRGSDHAHQDESARVQSECTCSGGAGLFAPSTIDDAPVAWQLTEGRQSAAFQARRSVRNPGRRAATRSIRNTGPHISDLLCSLQWPPLPSPTSRTACRRSPTPNARPGGRDTCACASRHSTQ